MKQLSAVILPVLRLTIIAVGLSFSGCSQGTSKSSLETSPDRWVKVTDKGMATAKSEEMPSINPETFLATGRLMESQGNLVHAAEAYYKACQAKGDYVVAWNRLGIIYDKLGKYDQAEDAFKQAIRHAPNTAFLHNNLGFSCLLVGKYDEAEDHLRQALNLNSRFQRARVNLGMALAKQGQFETSLSEFKKALPEPQAYYNLAYLHRQAGDWQQAGSCYKRALELDPSLAEAQTNLAVCQQFQTPSVIEEPEVSKTADSVEPVEQIETSPNTDVGEDIEPDPTAKDVEKLQPGHTTVYIGDLWTDRSDMSGKDLAVEDNAAALESINTDQTSESAEEIDSDIEIMPDSLEGTESGK